MIVKNNNLLAEAKRIVDECSERDILYIGPKPWFQRAFTKLKFGIIAGLITGVSGFGIVNMAMTPSLTNDNDIKKPEQTASGEITKIEKTTIKANNAIDDLRAEYPSVNFEDINNQRDVVKGYIGKNNFIALAAEMEGFRGDLHKDPAVGMNIGFGYNISKRVASSPTDVVKDLISIGMDNDTVIKIVEMAKKPQSQLAKEIKKFNQNLDKKDNQLISIEQGVALLKRTQLQYQSEAKNVFNSSFEKMNKHQQEVLTYAAYKAGADALSKYKKAINAANFVYTKKSAPNTNDLKSIAKELTFYYMKDGKEMVLDQRASLIAQTFVHQDYLSVQVGKTDNLQHSMKKLNEQKIDFSGLKIKLNSDNDDVKTTVHVKFNKDVLTKFRDSSTVKSNLKYN